MQETIWNAYADERYLGEVAAFSEDDAFSQACELLQQDEDEALVRVIRVK